jgi:hypothetical protein
MASKGRHGRNQQRERLRDISTNDQAAIADAVAIRVEEAVDASDLDAKMFALVIAALVATGGDEAGASVDEVTAVLTAVGPNVGVFKMVAAADPLATALGINLAGDAATGDDDGP